MYKVAYNAKCGSFYISEKAFELYKKYGGTSISNNSFSRHDKILIKVIEELGDKVNTDLTDIKIAVLSGNKYRIEENNGAEKIVEPEEKTYITIEDENKQSSQKNKTNDYQLKDFIFSGIKTDRDNYLPLAYGIGYEKGKDKTEVPYIKNAILLKDTEINGIEFNFGIELEDIIDILYSEKSEHRRNNIYISMCNKILSEFKKEK